ncbi:transglutaminase-like domain-containing protein [Paenibacillus marinisediminis]
MLTTAQQKELSLKFEQMKLLAGEREQELFDVLDTCTAEEKVCMQYLYAHMPISDMANYDGDLFLKFVRHALKVRSIMPWGKDIEDSMFLNYVLQYRINNENVDFYRELFFEEIYPTIKEMDIHEATIAVNYWCLEKATYQSTDIRTASPFTILRNAYGRCGEESTLAVAALRSVGIPARQCYAPRWTHCDDNHAWVEVWIDGRWQFLGACEPEMRLNTGWFRLAASKGMHIHSKAFSDLVERDEIVAQSSRLTEITILDRYADTKVISVRVVDAAGDPVEGVNVRFEIMNYAELFSLAILKTNEAGEVSFRTGYGDIVVFAHNERHYVMEKMDTRKADSIELVLDECHRVPTSIVDLTLVPPVGGVEDEPELSTEVEHEQKRRSQEAESKRKVYEATFCNGERATDYAAKYGEYAADAAALLEQSRGNYAEIIAFLEDETTNEHLAYKIALLQSLNKKDLTDITNLILRDHLIAAMPYLQAYDNDIFTAYLLCPRIAYEVISSYRSAILEAISEEQQRSFRADPQSIYRYVDSAIKTCNELEYETLSASPAGLLALKAGSILSKKLLCVSIMRTLGIPARIEKADDVVEYWSNGAWVIVPTCPNEAYSRSASLTLKKASDVSFDYYRNYSVAILEEGHFTTLNFEDSAWSGDEIRFELKPGTYRVITADRQADGTLHNKLYHVQLEANEHKALSIELAEVKGLTKAVPVRDYELKTLDGNSVKLSELLNPSRNIVSWLDVSAEPTEHLLNEIIESKDKFNSLKPATVLILKDAQDQNDPTLMKTLKEVPHIQLVVGASDDDIDPLYDGFDITVKKLPLAVIVEEELTATYGWSGYNVGIGDMLLKNLKK